MEPKEYQKKALESLSRYLKALTSARKLTEAWQKYWNYEAPENYHDEMNGVAKICLKVPTGGGKTFLACAALKEIFERLPRKNKLAVWLVPSESILTQTLKALQKPTHEYRKRLNKDFLGRVEVCSKEMLLQGQNFSPVTVAGNLTVCVMSYASIRIDSQKKDARKVYQENGALISFAEMLGGKEVSLINVLREMKPVIIVDESHNADSPLSAEMLENLNPSFVLELTATPKASSNIIYEVSGAALKAEHMIKLPVEIYAPKEKSDLISSVIALRGELEKLAEEEQIFGRYIRPIALIQAEPDAKNDSETFARVREDLIGAGIPAAEIAIKTSGVNELKDVDLFCPKCPIRYIITVNALKEGWDCSFAYILASLANRNSKIDVAQIVGRVLRQPGATESFHEKLNQAYVFSTYKDFEATVQSVVDGLENAGLPKSEGWENVRTSTPVTPPPQPEKFSSDMNGKFYDSVRDLAIPQFFIRVGKFEVDAFNPDKSGEELLSKENLSRGFSLAGADTKIDLRPYVVKIDADDEGKLVRGVVSLQELARDYQKFINKKTSEERLRFYVDSLSFYLHKATIADDDLKNYVRRALEGLSDADYEDLKIDTASFYVDAIREKIHRLEMAYRKKNFDALIGDKSIFCRKNYRLKKSIDLAHKSGGIAKALYSAEGDMNNFERDLIRRISGLENVTWWHRNIERQGFCLNGWLNHYPDFIVRLDSGRIILVEAKGGHLDNPDSDEKLRLGREWQLRAGKNFGYFMVFDQDISEPSGYTVGNFIAELERF